MDENSLEAAIFLVAAEGGQVVHVEVNVARNIKINEAVAIVVGPRRAGAEASRGYAGLVGHIFKFAAAEVAIKRVAAEAGDINIRQAVVVVVGDGNAHAPAFAGKSGRTGDVGKFEICVLMVKRDHGIAALAVAVDGRPVHRNDVELAVVVAVDQTRAAAHGFDDVLLFRRGNMGDGQARFFRYIFEIRQRRLRRGELRGFLWDGCLSRCDTAEATGPAKGVNA